MKVKCQIHFWNTSTSALKLVILFYHGQYAFLFLTFVSWVSQLITALCLFCVSANNTRLWAMTSLKRLSVLQNTITVSSSPVISAHFSRNGVWLRSQDFLATYIESATNDFGRRLFERISWCVLIVIGKRTSLSIPPTMFSLIHIFRENFSTACF